jgi:hypothetical protein
MDAANRADELPVASATGSEGANRGGRPDSGSVAADGECIETGVCGEGFARVEDDLIWDGMDITIPMDVTNSYLRREYLHSLQIQKKDIYVQVFGRATGQGIGEEDGETCEAGGIHVYV